MAVMFFRPASLASGRPTAPLVAAALLCALVALPPAHLSAQGAGQAPVPVSERFDPVTNAYRTEVVSPLPSDAVQAIQSALRENGYYAGPVTGDLDAATRAALRAFQVRNGLRISGHPDYETVVALGVPVRRESPRPVPGRPGGVQASRAGAIVILGPGDRARAGFRTGRVGAMATPAPPPEPGVAPVPESGVAPVTPPGAAPLRASPPAPVPTPAPQAIPRPFPEPADTVPESS